MERGPTQANVAGYATWTQMSYKPYTTRVDYKTRDELERTWPTIGWDEEGLYFIYTQHMDGRIARACVRNKADVERAIKNCEEFLENKPLD